MSYKIPLSEVRDETLLKLLDKLEKAYNGNTSHLFYSSLTILVTCSVSCAAHVSPLTESLETTMMTTELTDSSYGPYVLKHLKQNASLLEILKGNNLLQDGNCFVEFGAGRGSNTIQTKAIHS